MAVLEAGGRVVATPPVSSDGPDPNVKQSLVPTEATNEVGGFVVATPPVSSYMPDRRDQYANGAQLDSLEAHDPEEVEPTEQDRRSAAFVGTGKQSGRRKKLSARNDVQDLIKEMDPASCGPHV